MLVMHVLFTVSTDLTGKEGVGNAQHAHREHAEQADLLHRWHLERHQDRHRHDQRGHLAGDVDERRGHEDPRPVDTMAVGDIVVPGLGNRGAGEDHEGDDADCVDSEEGHEEVGRETEPADRGEAEVEEEDGEFGKELTEGEERRTDDHQLWGVMLELVARENF